MLIHFTSYRQLRKSEPYWEFVEYANSQKKGVPGGTTRELANRLSFLQESKLDTPLDEFEGVKVNRSGRLQGTQVHSIRLPGYTLFIDVVFEMENEKLNIRHKVDSSAEPYVDGALLAIREVNKLVYTKGLIV